MIKKKKLVIVIIFVLLLIVSFLIIYPVSNNPDNNEKYDEFSRYTQTQILNLYFNNIVNKKEEIFKNVTTNEFYSNEHKGLLSKFDDANILEVYVKKTDDETHYLVEIYSLSNNQVTLVVNEIDLLLSKNAWKIEQIHYFEEEVEVFAILNSTKASPEEVPQQIYTRYLDKFKEEDNKSLKIDDYSINEIEMIQQTDSRIKFRISYSVKPYSESSIFYSLGPSEVNGWVKDIDKFVDVIYSDSNYYMISDATGK